MSPQRVCTPVLLVTIAFLLAAPSVARADRDIVYSARYYTAPRSARTSHFHLYRISPDGSGRIQLTFGSADDHQPVWSPDSRRIAFIRRTIVPSNPDDNLPVLCVIGSNGGAVTRLKQYERNLMVDFRWSADGNAIIDDTGVTALPGRKPHLLPSEDDMQAALSPDGARLYVPGGEDEAAHDAIFNRARRKYVAIGAHLTHVGWADGRTAAGVCDDDGQSPTLCTVGTDGRVLHRVRFQPRAAAPGTVAAPTGTRVKLIQRIPGDPSHVAWWSDESNSTIRPFWGFYSVDVRTGRAVPICSGQFLTWSPDGRRYCTADRALTPYGRRWDGSRSVVWETPLTVVSERTGRRHNITPGRVWVDGADWRRTPTSPLPARRLR